MLQKRLSRRALIAASPLLAAPALAQAPFPSAEALDVAVRGVMEALPARSLLIVLSQGGSRHPSEVFESFRGRQPSPEALIRHTGLAGMG